MIRSPRKIQYFVAAVSSFIFSVLSSGQLNAASGVSVGRVGSEQPGQNVPPLDAVRLLGYAEFKKLSPQVRELYIVSLRIAMREVNEFDLLNGMKYEGGRSSRGTSAWLRLFLPSTSAQSDRACIYAGNFSELDSAGVCQSTGASGCSRVNTVRCNPLLFGDGVCVVAGATATNDCMNQARPSVEVARANLNREAEWNSLKNTIESYCRSRRETTTCTMLHTQVSRLSVAVLRGDRTSTQGTAALPPIAGPPVERPAEAARPVIPGSRGAVPEAVVEAPTGVVPAVGDRVATTANESPPPSGGEIASALERMRRGRGSCTPEALLEVSTSERSYTTGAAGGDWTLMTSRQAQNLMCEREINETWIADRRAALERRAAYLRGGNQAERVFHAEWIETLKANFEACYREAKQKQTNRTPPERTRTATLNRVGSTVSISGARNPNLQGEVSVHEREIGRLMMIMNVRLCDVNFGDEAPAQVSPAAASPAGPSRRAQ